ncbi:hypothetical protein GVAV_002588 [Gurleya vavrai]
MEKELKKQEKIIQEKIDKLSKRKENLVKMLRNLYEKLCLIKEVQNYSGDKNFLEYRIKQCKDKLKGFKIEIADDLIATLKIQKNVLKSYLN